MARRADHSKEELAALVIETAEKQIAEQGIEEFSARSLSREIGYTPGTLYHHFRDLDDIVTQVNSRTLGRLDAFFAGLKRSRDPKKMLHIYGDAFLEFTTKNRNLWTALFEFRRAAGSEVPSWYVETIAGLISVIAKCFTDIRPDVPHKVAIETGQLIFASIHSVVSLESSGRLRLVFSRTIKAVVHDLIDTHIAAYTAR